MVSEVQDVRDAFDIAPRLVVLWCAHEAESRVHATSRLHHRDRVDADPASAQAPRFVDAPLHHGLSDADAVYRWIDAEVAEAGSFGIIEFVMMRPGTWHEGEAPDDSSVEHSDDHVDGLGRLEAGTDVADVAVVLVVGRVVGQRPVGRLDECSRSFQVVVVRNPSDLHRSTTYASPMDDTQESHHRIATVEQLRQHYRQPSSLTVNKERATIDTASRQFLECCRFAVVGTFDPDGNADTSPRGGPSGWIRVLDEARIAMADLGGNNRLDSLQNVVATGRIAIMFVVPGQSETVRVNGAAYVSVDPDLLASFVLPKVPKSAIVVELDTTYVHCAKAFMRGGVWDPDAWAELAGTPDGATILSCQAVAEVTPEQIRGMLQDSYTSDLAAER